MPLMLQSISDRFLMRHYYLLKSLLAQFEFATFDSSSEHVDCELIPSNSSNSFKARYDGFTLKSVVMSLRSSHSQSYMER